MIQGQGRIRIFLVGMPAGDAQRLVGMLNLGAKFIFQCLLHLMCQKHYDGRTYILSFNIEDS